MKQTPPADGGTARARIEVHRRNGRPTALAFTSRAALVAALGRAQPWTLADTARLQDLLLAEGVDHLVLDPDPDQTGDHRAPSGHLLTA